MSQSFWLLWQENCDWKRLSCGGGAALFWANFLSHLKTHDQSSPSPYLTRFLKGSKGLAGHAWIKWFGKCTFTRLTIKRSGLVLSTLFFLSFFVSLPQFWSIHEAGLMQDIKTGKDLSSLFPFSVFISSLPCFLWAKCSYNTSTLYRGFLRRFGACWSLLW